MSVVKMRKARTKDNFFSKKKKEENEKRLYKKLNERS